MWAFSFQYLKHSQKGLRWILMNEIAKTVKKVSFVYLTVFFVSSHVGNFYYNKNEFPGLDLEGGSLPDVFFKLGEGGQIEVYDDGENGDGEDEEEEYDETEDPTVRTNDQAIQEEKFTDAEEKTDK